MDKYRKSVVELCATIELMDETAHHGQNVIVNANQWRLAKKLMQETKDSFNANMQFRYEQHIERERDILALESRFAAKPKEVADAQQPSA
jgi:hypothetical protein